MNAPITLSPKTAFVNAANDVSNSTFLLKLYVEGNENANYFYSKKEGFLESSDKKLLFLNMLNRFILKNNCFESTPQKKASHYLEVYAKSPNHTFDVIIFRCFSPASTVKSKYEFFNDFFGTQQSMVSARVYSIYESCKNGFFLINQPEAFHSSKDFHFKPFKSKKEWDKHYCNLVNKYGHCIQVSSYKDQYYKLYYSNLPPTSPQNYSLQRAGETIRSFNEFKRKIYDQIGKNDFDLYFKSLHLIDLKANTLRVQCQSEQHFQILENNFFEIIKTALYSTFQNHVYGKMMRLEYQILNK
jgi:hypothetical protein